MKIEVTEAQHAVIYEALHSSADTYIETAAQLLQEHGLKAEDAAAKLNVMAADCIATRDWWVTLLERA